jgi:hypothetical protein
MDTPDDGMIQRPASGISVRGILMRSWEGLLAGIVLMGLFGLVAFLGKTHFGCPSLR